MERNHKKNTYRKRLKNSTISKTLRNHPNFATTRQVFFLYDCFGESANVGSRPNKQLLKSWNTIWDIILKQILKNTYSSDYGN